MTEVVDFDSNNNKKDMVDKQMVLENVNRIAVKQLAQLVLDKELTLEELKKANMAPHRYKVLEKEVKKGDTLNNE